MDKITSLPPSVIVIILAFIFLIIFSVVKKALKLVLPKGLKGFAFLITAILLIWFIIFQNTPVVTYQNIYFDNLPKNLNGYKIVQVSDIHIDNTYNKVLKKSVELTNNEDMDLLVLTGDFVTSKSKDFEKSVKLFKDVKTKDGIYAVLGNHDYYACNRTDMRNILAKNHITLLENTSKKINNDLYIAGVEDAFTAFPNVKKAFSGVPKDKNLIFLSHSTEIMDSVPDRDMLMLTGHTHGWQIFVPCVKRGKLSKFLNKKYIEGYYEVGKIQLYVNRGIGYIKPAVRLFSRPEISVFVLKNKE